MLNFRKRKWIVNQKENGRLTDCEIASAQKVSRMTVNILWRSYQKDGLDTLKDKPVGRKVDEIPFNVQQAILAKRKEGFGVRKIEAVLSNEGMKISHNKIYHTLKQANLVIPDPKKGRRYNYIRWERKHSNSLWQTDFCWIPRLHKWLIAYLDDHSRFCTAATYTTEATTESAINLLNEAINKWNKPREVLSDRGCQFYAPRSETSTYKEHLVSLGINLIYSSIKKPTTTGKIERFWLTHNTERWRFNQLDDFIDYYNYKRLHMSLGYKTPYEIYMKDVKV